MTHTHPAKEVNTKIAQNFYLQHFFFLSLAFPCPSKPYCTALKLLQRMAGWFVCLFSLHVVSYIHIFTRGKKKDSKNNPTKNH